MLGCRASSRLQNHDEPRLAIQPVETGGRTDAFQIFLRPFLHRNSRSSKSNIHNDTFLNVRFNSHRTKFNLPPAQSTRRTGGGPALEERRAPSCSASGSPSCRRRPASGRPWRRSRRVVGPACLRSATRSLSRHFKAFRVLGLPLVAFWGI